MDFQAFHVLSADVQNKADARTEELGSLAMRHGFDFSDVNMQCGIAGVVRRNP
jgi:hypothetical protein